MPNVRSDIRLLLAPVALRTVLPSTKRFRQVLPSCPPPPIQKLIKLRSMVNRRLVSLPVFASFASTVAPGALE